MKIVLLDNEGAFTHTLEAMLRQAGAETAILGPKASREELLEKEPDGILITPGVGSASHAGDIGLTAQLVRYPSNIPVLGLGLGMLGLLHFSGSNLRPMQTYLHGSSVDVVLQPHTIFQDIPETIHAGCYVTTELDPLGLADGWSVIARGPKNMILGVAHENHPWVGLQFQPASVLTQDGGKIIENFLLYVLEHKA